MSVGSVESSDILIFEELLFWLEMIEGIGLFRVLKFLLLVTSDHGVTESQIGTNHWPIRVPYRIFGLGGEKSIGASTKRGNVRGLGVFSQILGGGNPRFPPLCMKPCQ